MATNAKDIIPAHATHPGSVLKSELQARGIKQKDFAKAIGMPAPNLSELIKGKRHMTEAIAIRLEEALGIPFQTWMNLQNRYHYVVKRQQEANAEEMMAVREEQILWSRLNLSALYKFYGIEAPTSAARLSMLRQHIEIDLSDLHEMEVNTAGYLKDAHSLKIDEINLRTWLLLARSEAGKTEIDNPYTPESGLMAASAIAQAANNGELTFRKLQEILNSNGIIFLHVPELDSAPVDAYSVMLARNPAIVVTCRQNSMDKLAFDVLHEIGHFRNNQPVGQAYISIEADCPSQSSEEKQADEFANNALIAPAIWKSIMSTGTKSLLPNAIVHTIANEAKKHGISSSIAVARYKHDTRSYTSRGYRSPKII